MRELMAELSTRGWRTVIHGPEAHLVLPVIYTLIGFAAMMIGRRKK